jgi:hypothetical protein
MDSVSLAQKTQRGQSTREEAALRVTRQGAHQRLRFGATEKMVPSGSKNGVPSDRHSEALYSEDSVPFHVRGQEEGGVRQRTIGRHLLDLAAPVLPQADLSLPAHRFRCDRR